MTETGTRTCANCGQDFTIEPADIGFYKSIGVPAPTWCPPCRDMRRSAWREDRTLYRDTCRLCGRSMISIHAPGGPFTVYCRECWWSDKWDALDYGRDYDFSRPFFAQYRDLMEAVPRPGLTSINCVNSEFTHACRSCKNCYLTFWSYFSEDSQYADALLFSRHSFDAYVTDNSDHAYEAVHSDRLYRTRYAYFSDDCLDSSFLFNCVGCSDCFGCVNMRKQKYRLFNEQLSKEEYAKEMAYWDLGSYKRLEEAKEKFRSLCLATPRRYAHVLNSQNVKGDVIRSTKDCQMCFSTLDGVQNCKYIYVGGLNLKDSYDVTGGGDTSELLYEVYGVTQAQRCAFTAGSRGSRDIMYCDFSPNSVNLFGCITIRNKKHCILNKQYSEKEYHALREKIVAHMGEMPYVDKKGRTYGFGEFFPMELSAYAYNETIALKWYPKTREQVLAEGLAWRDPPDRAYEISMHPGDLPDHIADVENSIVDQVIGCAHAASPEALRAHRSLSEVGTKGKGTCDHECTTAFRITPEELQFYRTMHIALPRLCPNCRHRERLQWVNEFRLYSRACMCRGKNGGDAYVNTVTHSHGDAPCANRFETTYPPGAPEAIYCEQCYKEEFL